MQKSLVVYPFTIEEAKSFLESRGYLVKKIEYNQSIVSNSDVILCFYDKLKEVLGEEYTLTLCSNDKADIDALDRFKKKAARLDIGKNKVNQYIIDYISIFFKYLPDLGLTKPPTSLSFFLSQTWMIERALNLNNQYLTKLEQTEEIFNEDDQRLEKLKQERLEYFLKDSN